MSRGECTDARADVEEGGETCDVVLLVELIGGLHGRRSCEKAAGESKASRFACVPSCMHT